MGQETGRPDGGERTQESSQWTAPQGQQEAGGQGERIEGTLTNGGSQPGERSFAPRTPGPTASEDEGGGAMSGRGQEEGGGAASGQQGDQDRPDADYDDRGYG